MAQLGLAGKETIMKKKTGKLLKCLVIVLIGLGLIYAVLLGISSMKLHRAYSALEKDKRPMSPEDVIPPALAPTENAALLYESAWLRLKAEPVGEADLLSHMADLAVAYNQGDPNAAMREEMEGLLQRDVVKNALQAIELGTQRAGCRFDVNYEGGIGLLLPHLLEMRHLARILAAQAHIQAQYGNAQGTWQSISTLLKFADGLRTEPTLVSQLVRMAIVGLATGAVYHLPDIALPDETQMTVINDLLANSEDNSPVIHAFDGERILFGESIFAGGDRAREQLGWENKSGGLVDIALAWSYRAYRLCKPLVQADHAHYLRITHEYAKMGQQPGLAHGPEVTRLMNDDMPKYLVISSLLAPAGDRVYQIHKRTAAHTRIMHVGLVLLRYRQDQGAFPESLSALNARIPPDPFSQKPLIYRREGNGFILYSVSSDGEDNGGIPKQKNVENWDIPWRYKGETEAAQ
jgi:hypothetical protein